MAACTSCLLGRSGRLAVGIPGRAAEAEDTGVGETVAAFDCNGDWRSWIESAGGVALAASDTVAAAALRHEAAGGVSRRHPVTPAVKGPA